ncbi:hypothetical protein HMPREF1606_00653, partial [Escherichia coli 908522]
FIPAGAGNTQFHMSRRAGSSVYPRWRGEHTKKLTNQPDTHGLSPLARGTPQAKHYILCVVRFIPAGAGNTLSIHNCF